MITGKTLQLLAAVDSKNSIVARCWVRPREAAPFRLVTSRSGWCQRGSAQRGEWEETEFTIHRRVRCGRSWGGLCKRML